MTLRYKAKCKNCGYKGKFYGSGKIKTLGCLDCKKVIHFKMGPLMHEYAKDLKCYKEKHKLIDYSIEKNQQKFLTCPKCGKEEIELTLPKRREILD